MFAPQLWIYIDMGIDQIENTTLTCFNFIHTLENVMLEIVKFIKTGANWDIVSYKGS